jgi:integrase
MKTYRPTFTDKNTGRKKKCAHYYLTFVDNRQIRRRLPAFSGKTATDRLGIMIQKLLDANGILDRDLQAWFTGLVPPIRDRLIQYSLVDSSRMMKHIDKSLEEHLQDFKDALLAKGNGGKYARQTASKVKDIFTDCGFRMWGDIDANAVYIHLGDMRGAGIGQRTFNCYLKSCKQFCKWMIKEQRATAPSPLEHLSCIKQTEKRRQRRAITVKEVRRLLETTQAAPERYGLSGAERALLYRLAIESGLRASELRSLTKSSFDFKGCTVTLQAAYSKRKRQDVLPLRPDTAAEIEKMLAQKLPTAQAFGVPDKPADMLKDDLKNAKIDYIADGKFFDFHSLRHETGTLLAASGVDVKTAQSLMRHSDVNLTMSIYTHTLRDAESKAVAKLPDLAAKTDEVGLSVA